MLAAGPVAVKAGDGTGLSRRRVAEWLRVFGTVGLGQVVTQGVGFVCGILIVRWLSTAQYAQYTLANATIGTLNVLVDVGVSAGVMAQGGSVWEDRKRLGAVIRTGLALRRRFALIVVWVACPVLGYLLRQHGADWASVIGLLAGVIGTYLFAVAVDLYSVAPKLHQALPRLQMIGALAAALRLVTFMAVLFWFPNAIAAVAVALIAQIWNQHRLRRLAGEYADLEQREDPLVRKAILGMVARVLPGAVYFGLSGQVGVWLLSVLGSGVSVAQVGAISRLGQMITVASFFIAATIEPRYARLPEDRALLRRRYLQVHGMLVLGCATLVALTAAFPDPVLSLLGTNYRGLRHEMVLQVVCSCAYLQAGVAFSMAASRGWVMHPGLSLPILLLVQIVAIMGGRPGTVSGVIWIAIWPAIVQWLLLSAFVGWRCRASAGVVATDCR